MNTEEFTIAGISTIEEHDQMNQALNILHDDDNIIGINALRSIVELYKDYKAHTLPLLALSLELPLMIEFYNHPQKIEKVTKNLKSKLDSKHIVSWPTSAHHYLIP